MLDLKFIRENIDLVREAIARRKDSAPLDEILKLDNTGMDDVKNNKGTGKRITGRRTERDRYSRLARRHG